MSEIKPRKPWFANRLVEYYENDTEPKQFPDAYTQYIEISAYDKLKAENEELKLELKQKAENGCCIVEHGHRVKAQHDLASAKELIGKLKVILMFYSNEQNVALDAASNEYIEREMFAGFLEFFDKPLGTTAHDAVKQIEQWEAGK